MMQTCGGGRCRLIVHRRVLRMVVRMSLGYVCTIACPSLHTHVLRMVVRERERAGEREGRCRERKRPGGALTRSERTMSMKTQQLVPAYLVCMCQVC
jgi:hypothetical protein